MSKIRFEFLELFLYVDERVHRDCKLGGTHDELRTVAIGIATIGDFYVGEFVHKRVQLNRRDKHQFLLLRDVLRCTHITYAGDNLFQGLYLCENFTIKRSVTICIIERSAHYSLSLFALIEVLPQFLGDERHVRMKQYEQAVEECESCFVRSAVDRLLVSRFDHLQIPAAELVAVEFVDLHERLAQTIFAEQVCYYFGSLAKLGVEPLNRIFAGFGLRDVCYLQTLHHTEAVPDLIAEVPSLLAERIIIEDVVTRWGTQQNTHTHTIGTETLNQIQRIGTVTKTLGHLTSQFITYDTGEIDVLERHLAHVLVTCHDHTGYPEEDDVRSCYEVCGRVVIVDLFVVRVLNTVEQGNRPQPRAEPCIQRTLVLNPFHLCTLYIVPMYIRVSFADKNLVIRVVLQAGFSKKFCVIPCRDAVTPPELAGDTPVFDVLKPVAVGVLVFGRIENDLVVHYRR